MQDGSSLRRGKPAAHAVFGIGETINTATYLMNEALCLIQSLSPSAVAIYCRITSPKERFRSVMLTSAEEMRNLHVGQGHGIYWNHRGHVPTSKEYIGMIDGSMWDDNVTLLSHGSLADRRIRNRWIVPSHLPFNEVRSNAECVSNVS